MMEVQMPLYKVGGIISIHLCNYLVSMPSGIAISLIPCMYGHSGFAWYICPSLRAAQAIICGHGITIT